MITTIVALILTGAVFAIIAHPLLRDRREPALRRSSAYDHALEDLLVQRDETYAAIKELDFDHQMGNLAAEDHQQLRERYRRKAAAILHDLDQMQSPPAAPAPKKKKRLHSEQEPPAVDEDDIEREVRRRRARRRPALHQPQRACAACDAALEESDRYCAACGASLGERCPGCGAPYESEDRFCAGCGSAVPGVAR